MIYKEGAPLREGIKRYSEKILVEFSQSGLSLFLIFDNLTKDEIKEIKKAKLDIGLCKMKEIIFFLFKFGNLPWVDAPYSIHLSKEKETSEVEEGQGYLLNIVLVNASTGVVEALRAVGTPTRFSETINEMIDEQRSQHFEATTYNQHLNEIYQNYSTKKLLEYATVYKVKESGVKRGF